MRGQTFSSMVTAAIGLALTGCAPPATMAPGDGTWSGRDTARMYDFNSPDNWVPRGVPTGTATIPADSPAVPFVRASQPTTLAAIKLTGNLGLSVDPSNTLVVTQRDSGITMCCGQAQLYVTGELTGDVTIGSPTSPVGNQISGYGTIKGSVIQHSGTIGGSRGSAGERTLTVVGNYRITTAIGATVSDVLPGSATSLDVKGTASIGGGTLFIAVADSVTSAPPYKVLTAGRVDGKYGNVILYPPGSPWKADVTYSSTDVTVTLRK